MKKNIISSLKSAIFSVDWKNVSVGCYVSYIMSIIVVLNTILDIFGLNPINISESGINTIVTMVISIITILVATYNTWHNNSTSREAIVADAVMDVLKSINDASKKDSAIEQLTTFVESLKDYSTDVSEK